MKWMSILVPLTLSALAYRWVPIMVLYDMNQGLLAFLGLLAAAIVQVIPVTANFLQSDRLTPTEARRLSKQLSAQQKYWVGLLVSTVIAFAVIVVVSVLKERTEVAAYGYSFSIGPTFSALVVFCLVFLVMRLPQIVRGVLSLQELRSELVLNAALRNAAEEVRERQAQEIIPGNVVSQDYGAIVRH